MEIETPNKVNENFLFKTSSLRPKSEKKRELVSCLNPTSNPNIFMIDNIYSTENSKIETNYHEKQIYENEDKSTSKELNSFEEEKSQNEKQNTSKLSKFSYETDQKTENDTDSKMLCKKRKPTQELEIYMKCVDNDKIEHVSSHQIYENLTKIIQNKDAENDGFYQFRYCSSSLEYLVKEYGFNLIIYLLIEFEKIYGNTKLTKEGIDYLSKFRDNNKNRYLLPEQNIIINKSQLKKNIRKKIKKKTKQTTKTEIKIRPRRSSRIKYNQKIAHLRNYLSEQKIKRSSSITKKSIKNYKQKKKINESYNEKLKSVPKTRIIKSELKNEKFDPRKNNRRSYSMVRVLRNYEPIKKKEKRSNSNKLSRSKNNKSLTYCLRSNRKIINENEFNIYYNTINNPQKKTKEIKKEEFITEKLKEHKKDQLGFHYHKEKNNEVFKYANKNSSKEKKEKTRFYCYERGCRGKADYYMDTGKFIIVEKHSLKYIEHKSMNKSFQNNDTRKIDYYYNDLISSENNDIQIFKNPTKGDYPLKY